MRMNNDTEKKIKVVIDLNYSLNIYNLNEKQIYENNVIDEIHKN